MPPGRRFDYNLLRNLISRTSLRRTVTVLSRLLPLFLTDDSGQGLVEYALIVALISIVAIAALRAVGQQASNTMSNAAGKLS